jgi:hypothetical protein
MGKLNCWESKRCGREPGGIKTGELGICPAASREKADGIHGGVNGGRCCWVIAGTLCNGHIQGIYASKLANCILCDFYQLVHAEEGKNRIDPKALLALLASPAEERDFTVSPP